MLRICTTVRCGGHNDRGWSLCLSCKSRGNFERLFRPARLACACLPCPVVLRSSLPVPTQNRWVGDRLVIKRSFARATFSQATKEKRGGRAAAAATAGPVTTEMFLSRRSSSFPIILLPRRAAPAVCHFEADRVSNPSAAPLCRDFPSSRCWQLLEWREFLPPA